VSACGYSRIPGVDFQESYEPVINDMTFRILLVTLLTWNLIGKVINIETAFLHGELKETIFMEIPKGTEASKNVCLISKLPFMVSSKNQIRKVTLKLLVEIYF
jgi:Reverse transcriptase (RNA-dependent DNA polymerase)